MGESFRQIIDLIRPSAESNEHEKLLDKDFFEIQLRFVERVRALNPQMTLEKAIADLTCIHNRLGLGPVAEGGPTHPLWKEYAKGFHDASGDLDFQRLLSWTYEFYIAHHDRQVPIINAEGRESSKSFGWFWYDYIPGQHAIDPHFRRPDGDAKIGLDFFKQLKSDLREMFSDIKSNHSDVTDVIGGSWLLGNKQLLSVVRAYKLLPESFLKPLPREKGRTIFRGLGTWGQFLDADFKTKRDMKTRFFEQMKTVGLENLEDAFPIPRIQSRAPISDFYDHFGIK